MAHTFKYNTVILSEEEYNNWQTFLNDLESVLTCDIKCIESTYTIENRPQFIDGYYRCSMHILEKIK